MIASATWFDDKGTGDNYSGDDQKWLDWARVVNQSFDDLLPKYFPFKRQVFRSPVKSIIKVKAAAGRPQRSALHTSRNVWINTYEE